VRLAAIRALGATRAENALPLLISLLEDADAEVVAAARAALAWLSEPPAPGAPAKSQESGGSGD
jgi:HEAT repeat protein